MPARALKPTALLAVAVAAVFAIPGSAVAATECDGGTTVGGITVSTDPQASDDAIVSLCVDTDLAIDGGYVEAGNGPPGTYAVIDGSDASPSGTPLAGYAGVSNYGGSTGCHPNITHAPGPIEDTTNDGTGPNGGGCFTIRGVASVPGVPLACGNTSGSDFAAAGRDGCTIP